MANVFAFAFFMNYVHPLGKVKCGRVHQVIRGSRSGEFEFGFQRIQGVVGLEKAIRSILMHSDIEYRPIEFPVSHLLQKLGQSVVFRTTTLFTIGCQCIIFS